MGEQESLPLRQLVNSLAIVIKKIIGLGLLLVSLSYIVGGVYLYSRQRELIYHPAVQNFDDCPGFQEYQRINYRGTRFYLKPQSENVLVYYHGNAGSACSQSSLKAKFEATGYSLIFPEYAGYSNDDQAPSKALLLNDVQNINTYLSEQNYQKIIVYGQSLGTAAASYQAKLGQVDGVVLLSPFARMQDVVQRQVGIYPTALLLTETFDNIAALQDYKGSILILHGDQDTLIPPAQSAALFESISTNHKEYVIIPGKDHFDMWSAKIVSDKILAFAALLSASPSK